jgi:hypothetical protein
VWCFDGQRPLAPVQHRYDWAPWARSGGLRPSRLDLPTGGTAFHLGTRVSIPLFAGELEAFARQVGASPTKQIVLVLDRAGWHSSRKLRVPDHLHLLLPVLLAAVLARTPTGRAPLGSGPLTNTVLHNRHFATIDELEDAQAQRCVALQAHPELIRSTTRFQWWPQRIRKRQGPSLN